VTRCEKICLIRGDAGRMRFTELRQHVPDIRRGQSAYDAREPGPRPMQQILFDTAESVAASGSGQDGNPIPF
jgi:hypothetical protein